MSINYPIFQNVGLVLLAAILLTGCSPKPQTTLATPTAIKQEIGNSDAPLLLVHAWATWCQPCLVEFPELVKVYNQFHPDGLELLLVSADDPGDLTVVQSFLAKHESPVGSLVTTKLDQNFIESLSPNWGGALPASFLYANGKLLAEWEGKRSYEHYATQIGQLLKTTKGVNP